MIDQNTRDRESWLKEVSIASLKENDFLLENDIVLVAENNCFYKVVNVATDVPLKNNLFAQIMPSEIFGNISTSNKLKNPFNLNLSGAVLGECSIDGSSNVTLKTLIEGLDASKINSGILHVDRIPELDASKITTGTIDIARLPAAAMERLIEVPDDNARFALTPEQVNMGDVVKVTSTLKMYKVIDTKNLNNENGYSVFVAGSAAEVPWEGVIGKPSTMPNPYDLTVKLNGVSNTTYNGEFPREVNITASSVGAYFQSEVDAKIKAVEGKINASTIDMTSLLNTKADKLHGNHVPSTQNPNNSVFLRNDNTWYKITPNDIGAATKDHTHAIGEIDAYSKAETDAKLNLKANVSHGNHVPQTETADNKKFLRNDNTWQIVTPYNIGAQPAGDYASRLHSHLSTHITQDSNNRFVTDSEKQRWNSKADAHGHPYLSINGGTVSGALTVNGDLRASRVFNAVWNDYAEFFERGEQTEAGDIIALDTSSDKEQYIKASMENPVVVGVHSDSFAHLIGGKEVSFEENLKEFIPVGLAGRVKVKVIGKVLKGQYIGLSNLPGIGSTVDYLNPYIVGIALEDKLTEGLGIIKILTK